MKLVDSIKSPDSLAQILEYLGDNGGLVVVQQAPASNAGTSQNELLAGAVLLAIVILIWSP